MDEKCVLLYFDDHPYPVNKSGSSIFFDDHPYPRFEIKIIFLDFDETSYS